MAPSPTPDQARSHLAAWRAARSTDPYAADLHLAAVNRRYVDAERLAVIERSARPFGQQVVAEIGPLVEGYAAHPPRLDKYDGLGNRIEEVRFDGDHHTVGDLVWGSGLLAAAGAPGGSFEQANLFYLASQEGEMGHMCAATCTTGIVRVLRRARAGELIARYGPGLCAADGTKALRGAQYLTEVQGGSDVGANAVVARPQHDGTYRIDGEKWFCSVAEADLFLVTARPAGASGGTSGLGCFLIPRHVDGVLNGLSIRRLKDKLGTVSMASGEIDFVDAVAFPVGVVERGFGLMVEGMLNASRWLNAVGNVGIMRRALDEAAAYARHRRAFGQTIGAFPAVQQLVASIKLEWLAALHTTWALTALDELADRAGAGESGVDPDGLLLHRFVVNANKLSTSQACSAAVRDAIEVLGGNGAIETFSVLPRLLRDSVVYEQWEGTHNVLTAQIARDLAKLGLLDVVTSEIRRLLQRTERDVEPLRRALDDVRTDGRRALEDRSFADWHMRRLLTRTVRLHQAALLLDTAVDEPELADELEAASLLLTRRELTPGYRPEDDGEYAKLVGALLGPDDPSGSDPR